VSKSILITGCSSGIGFDAAQTLRDRGWRVFATCRKEEDAERLRELGHESWALDYSDAQSVAAGADEALKRSDGQLDALFNNGAFALPGCAMPYRGAYNASKFAMEGMTDTYRMELHGTGVHMILIEPGPITTRIRVNSQQHFETHINWKEAMEREVYERDLIPRLYDESGTPDAYELPPSAVTAKLIHALESPNPAPRYFVTRPTYISNILRRFLPTRMLDRVVRGWAG